MSMPCSPTCFAASLELLRVELGGILGDSNAEIDRLVRCQGLDVLTGEWIADRVRAGLDPWLLVDALRDAVQALVDVEDAAEERTRAALILALSPALHDVLNGGSTGPLEELVELFHKRWDSKLSKLACGALLVAFCMDEEGQLKPEQVNVEIREFVRDAFDYGGLSTVQAVIEDLRAYLGEGATP